MNTLFKLAGEIMTGALSTTTSGNNPFFISPTATNANNCIQMKNHSTYTASISLINFNDFDISLTPGT
jgi:hypothetical protein